MYASSYHDKLYLTSSVDFFADPNETRIFAYDIVEPNNISYSGYIDIQNPPCTDSGYGYFATITSITENPNKGTLYAAGIVVPRVAHNYINYSEDQSIDAISTLTEIPAGVTGPVTANEVAGSDLALALSIVWKGDIAPVCEGANLDGTGSVDLADFTILASQWQQTGSDLTADIASPRDYCVDILDLAVIAEYWLSPDCN